MTDPARVDAGAARAMARRRRPRHRGRCRWRVAADSEADAGQHGKPPHRQPEGALAAFRGRAGRDIRTSATLGLPFLYVAVPCPGGAVRLAEPLARIDGQVAEMRTRILDSTAVAFLPAVLLAALVARWISRRFATIMSHAYELARGNFRARMAATGGGEFGRLARTLNETAANLQRTVEQLQREHAELEKVERIRKDFVINVSHELRTPLASIQGYTETLLDGALPDPDHNMRFLGIIRHNVERLARLTEDLLTLSRIEQKRQQLDFEPRIHLDRLLRTPSTWCAPSPKRTRSDLVSELDPRVPRSGAHGKPWTQMLSNLLENAIKYTPAGGAIAVGARPAGHFMEVFVRDTGIGIPAEDLPRLFERFYRVDKARSRELGGTGLGLSIVKHLVAAHNGTVRVESHTQQGSTFYFTLPADESALPPPQLNPEFMAL